MWSTGRCDPAAADEWPWPLVLRDNPRARRFTLRLDTRNSRILLTCPPRASRRKAIAWAEQHREWALAQIQSCHPRLPLEPGATIPFDGSELTLRWSATARRTPALVDGDLTCGGPIEHFEGRIERWLRRRARERLSEETAQAAASAGVSVAAVSIGDADSRWGSCSARGRIRYNWRLLLAPPSIRRWVVAHEVAHRVHMNHGPAFKALEKKLYGGDVAAARSELRRIGPGLKRVGRGV